MKTLKTMLLALSLIGSTSFLAADDEKKSEPTPTEESSGQEEQPASS